ncbi:hypothetical protein BM1_04263 [Bipolaris maydis]|nr:hypothetical protein BM1_04263 [Bipolaris maydis]
MYLLPQNRTVRSYTDAVAGCQNQASLSNLQSSYRRTPPRQQEPGQRVPDTQSQRTGHLPATRRPTYAEVVRKQKPISSQYNSTHPLGPGSTLAENVQPWGPPRHGPGTANRRDVASDMTTDIMSDQEQMSDEMMFAMYTHGGNSEGAHESSPSNSMTYRRSVLPSSAPTRGRLGNDDDDPWSTVHQRGSQNSMVSPRPHLPVMGPSAFQPNHAGGGTYLAPPDLYHLSHVRNFNHDIHNAIQNAQPTRPNRVYGQTDHGTTQNTNHRRASRQVHPNQRVPSSANDRQINNDSVVRSGDRRSHPSASTTSMPSEPLQCHYCDAQFKGNKDGKGNLARHIRHKHKKDRRQILCEYCGQLFQRTDARLKHHRNKHPNFHPPNSSSQRSRQSSIQIQAGVQHEAYSTGSRGFNDFEALQDYTASMGQPDQHPDDLRGLAY